MIKFWNERYASSEYAYGTEPNQFLKNQLKHLKPGKILFPAEGEGRNAIYAAKLGWDVYAFDSSNEAAKKAMKLAYAKSVTLQYNIADITELPYPDKSFNCIALIFFHMHPPQRNIIHKQMLGLLVPGGTLLLIGFSKNQIRRNNGGPRNVEMLFSKEELENDFSSASKFEIMETEFELNEGLYHQGLSDLIQVIAVK